MNFALGRPEFGTIEDRIYIFVTSSIPDPYINVLVHALKAFKLTQACFVAIKESGLAGDSAESNRLHATAAEINKMFSELANGEYGKREASGRMAPSISLQPVDTAMYQKCWEKWQRLEHVSVVIPYAELDSRLKKFAQDGHAIFDVTALKKNLLLELVVLLISHNCTEIFEFEILRRKRYFDERDLIHSLTPSDEVQQRDYIYRKLTDAKYLKIAERRMMAKSVTFRLWVALTIIVGIVVLVVQLLFPSSIAETTIAAIATTAAIAGWLVAIRRS